jgi:hypothetical protein
MHPIYIIPRIDKIFMGKVLSFQFLMTYLDDWKFHPWRLSTLKLYTCLWLKKSKISFLKPCNLPYIGDVINGLQGGYLKT